MGRTPGGVHIVVGRTHVGGIGIGQPPLLWSLEHGVGGHPVETACLQGGDTLRHDEGLAGEVLRHILDPLVMIVEADDVEGTALEEMVARGGFVAACRDGARRVVTAHDLCQMLREE